MVMRRWLGACTRGIVCAGKKSLFPEGNVRRCPERLVVDSGCESDAGGGSTTVEGPPITPK